MYDKVHMLLIAAQRGRWENHNVKIDFLLSLMQFMHVDIRSMLGFVLWAGEIRVVFSKLYFFYFKTYLEKISLRFYVLLGGNMKTTKI